MTTSAEPEPVRGVLLLHGWQNRRPVGHWQRWLTEQLAARGHVVHYPQLPQPDDPDLDTWLATVREQLAALRGVQVTERVLICHSLACALWLHLVAESSGPDPGPDPIVDRVLLVAPPSPKVVGDNREIAAFVPPSTTSAALAAAAPGGTRMVGAADDPYCPEGAEAAYGALGVDIDVLPGGGHLDLEAGYGDWPSVLAWFDDPATRIRPRPGG
jgi:predicted alpha/beta hydrolase family esterase